MDWNKKNITNIMKIVAFGIVLYWALNNILTLGNVLSSICSILSPFILGVALAFIINIPMTIFEKKVFVKKRKSKKKNEVNKISKGKRLACILISLIIIILVIIGVVFLVIPEIINAIGEMVSYLPELLSKVKEVINKLIEDYPEVKDTLEGLQTNLETFNSEMIKELTTIGTNLISSSFGVISSTIGILAKAVIAIIFAIYMLMDKEKICLQIKRMTYAFCDKKVADRACEISLNAKEAFNNFITGQFTECIILGSLCAIGMLILRLPYSAVVGVLVAITAFIPIVGALFGGFVGAVLLLPISLTKSITFIIFFVILQQIENNLIYPKVVGSRVGVPGWIVLIAITLGNAMFGVVGMVVALPLTSILYSLIAEATSKRLEQKYK